MVMGSTSTEMRAEGEIPLTQVLLGEGARLGRGVTMVVITPSLDQTWVAAARDLARRGVRLVAIVVDPESFGGTGQVTDVLAELQISRIPAYLVHNGDDLTATLSRPVTTSRGPRIRVAARVG